MINNHFRQFLCNFCDFSGALKFLSIWRLEALVIVDNGKKRAGAGFGGSWTAVSWRFSRWQRRAHCTSRAPPSRYMGGRSYNSSICFLCLFPSSPLIITISSGHTLLWMDEHPAEEAGIKPVSGTEPMDEPATSGSLILYPPHLFLFAL